MILGVLPPSGGSLASLERTGQRRRFIDHYLQTYARAFDRVYYFSYRDEEDVLPERCTLVPNRTGAGKGYGLRMPITHAGAFRACDVLRVMQAPGAHPAMMARFLHGTPYVVTFGFHYSEFVAVDGGSPGAVRRMRLRERLACRFADAVIRPAHTVDDRLLALAPPSRIVDIPNAVDCERFNPASAPTPTPYPVFVGRLAPQKNLPLLIEALSGLPGVPLRLIGQGGLREDLEARARDHGVTIRWAEAVANEDLPEEFRRAGVFVLPSLIEGMPKVLLEAMACGCACLGNDAPGIRDLIRHGENGLLFDGSVEDCRRQLDLLLRDAALRERLGRGARAMIERNFNLQHQLDREVRLLQAVGRRGRRRGFPPKEAPEFE